MMPTLKALRVRLNSRLFLLPLKSFCKQKSFGDTPFFSAWRNLVIRSTVLFITGFLDCARNDIVQYIACSWFVSFCHTDRSGAYLVIRSTVLYTSGFLDCARNDIVQYIACSWLVYFCHTDRSGAYFVIRSIVRFICCHFDQALARGEISLFI